NQPVQLARWQAATLHTAWNGLAAKERPPMFPWSCRWLSNRGPRSIRRVCHGCDSRGTASRFRPRLEGLEDRVLPAILTVLNLNDSGPGSLRQAILDANNETLNPGPDTIQFDPSLAHQTIDLTSADTTPLFNASGTDFILGPSAFRITSNITIDGGSGGITITRDGTAPDFRFFQVLNPDDPTAASLTLRNLTLNNGLARGGDGAGGGAAGGGGGGGAGGLGGALLNLGTLMVEGVTFTGNQAVGGNGGAGTTGTGNFTGQFGTVGDVIRLPNGGTIF